MFKVIKGLDEPLEGQALKWAKKSAYKRLPLPKALRKAIKLPFFAIFDLYTRNVRRRNFGQSYYIAARKNDVQIKGGNGA
jgi:hypothetical protein